MSKEITRTVFVVPFFCDGEIVKMRVYSNPLAAQRALKRYVSYSQLLRRVKLENPKISARRATLHAYAAIGNTRLAGTVVYEIAVDDRTRGARVVKSRAVGLRFE